MADFVIGQKAMIVPFRGAPERVTIERDTKMHWVAGSRKFRKTDGRMAGRSEYYPMPRLLPIDDPIAIKAEREARIEGAWSNVRLGFDRLRQDRANRNAIDRLLVALDDYAELLD